MTRTMKNTLRLTAIILTVLTVCAVVMLVSARRELRDSEQMTEELSTELQSCESENRKLCEKLGKLETDEYTEELAREKLGLVRPDEIIFLIVQK